MIKKSVVKKRPTIFVEGYDYYYYYRIDRARFFSLRFLDKNWIMICECKCFSLKTYRSIMRFYFLLSLLSLDLKWNDVVNDDNDNDIV
jgi:hypothetical protein